jgi:BirA family biotin operon repressor/biotin-[acetyl-CoA-carboxylase] ligase
MRFVIHRLDRVGSTNKYAFDLCKNKDAKEGEVFLAKEQYEGRGYHANSWLSEPGKNLTFSLILQPDFILPARQFLITQFISLAILDLLNELIHQENMHIKWPNDIYINDVKVGGILVQNTIIGNAFEYSIIGIGLNVNQKEFSAELPNPTSIIHYSKEENELDDLLNDLLNCIDKRYERLMMVNDTKALEKEYLDHLYRFNQIHDFKDENGSFKGKITGVGEYGELMIVDESGTTKAYHFKEVEFL